MTRLAAVLTVVLAAGTAGAAEIGRLDGPAITAAVSGRDFDGVYADGSQWSESYRADGTIEYKDEETGAGGAWRVVGERLCTLYSGGIEGGCFLVVRRSENCFHFYNVSTEDGVPEASSGEIDRGENWTAQGWDSGRLSTCPVGDVT